MKKRIISLVVALCMMLSLVPFTAFAESDIALFAAPLPAETETGALVLDRDGAPILSIGVGNPRQDIIITGTDYYSGTGWDYDAPQGQTTATLYLYPAGNFDGKFDFSSQPYTSTVSKDITVVIKNGSRLENATVAGDLVIEEGGTVENVSCTGKVTNNGTILGDGTFTGEVTNNGTISDGIFNGNVDNKGTIEGGTFTGSVTNDGTIQDGGFNDVTNNGKIEGGSFTGKVNNTESGTIHNGSFSGTVDNKGDITDGSFSGNVDNSGHISGGTFTDTSKVDNKGNISGGDFSGSVNNETTGIISNGSFTGEVKNDGTITGGNFKDTGKVDNNGSISGGSFDGKVDNSGNITGGDFNGDKVDNRPGSTYEPTHDSAAKPENPDNPSDDPSDKPSDNPSNDPSDKPSDNPSNDPSDDPSKDDSTYYTVTVEGGTINGAASATAKEGDELTVVLDKNLIPDGMTFDIWSVSSSKLNGDPTVALKSETMTFFMPPENVSIRAHYRSAEIPGDDGDDAAAGRSSLSPAGVALLATTGAAVTGVALWEGYQFVVNLYLSVNLPDEAPVPTNRRELAFLMWKTAGKPEVELTDDLYSDIDPQDIELRKAAQWAEENQLMEVSNERNLTLFDPDSGVTNIQVFHAWRKLKKLLKDTDAAVVTDAADVS